MNLSGIRVVNRLFNVAKAVRSCSHHFRGYSIKRLLICDPNEDATIKIQGWVKSTRVHKEVVFLAINDGSCRNNLQVLVPHSDLPSGINYGSCIEVEGQLVESLRPDHQKVEVKADTISVLGMCDSQNFPFKSGKTHPADYVRQFPHLRPRANQFTALLRVRNAASAAVHEYFQSEGFCHIHTPVLTSNDCEGAGEVFQVEPADRDLVEKTEEGQSQHFFDVPTFLTVSGQLHLEAVTGAISKVYTFGPTFRAENSRGRHHLSEFYMVEAEVAFVQTLEEILQVIEGLVKHVCKTVLDTCDNDMGLHLKYVAPNNHMKDLVKLLDKPFQRMTYSEAIGILEKHQNKFKFPVEWGADLHKEHERHLVAHCDSVPVFVTDYPAEIKPFYMKANPDTRTVAAVDLLAAGVGEIVGGSLREDDLEVLTGRLEKLGLKEPYDWYLDLRRYGSAPHGGFGLGFERLLQVLLGIANIKDTIPFPRSTHNCKL